MRHYYAVAFRALHLESQTIKFGVDISVGASEDEVTRLHLGNLVIGFPRSRGWSNWDVVVSQIPEREILRVIREASWFEQTGSHHLYASGILAVNKNLGKTIFASGYVLAYNPGHAVDQVGDYLLKHCPLTEGWESIKTGLRELPEINGYRQCVTPMTWDHGCYNAKGC